ncbi:MAG: group 1 truncated hemoglobin [Dehalococcoidia bacterium]|nr:group 1 truncated hemoglobin [Dehalococcoidia bacterium]
MTTTVTTSASLYERLGGAGVVRAIANDLIEAHLANSEVAPRFRYGDAAEMKRVAFEFMASGSGGQEGYTSRELREAHKGMNISDHEFVAVCDDLLAVMKSHGIGAQEQNELLGDLLRTQGRRPAPIGCRGRSGSGLGVDADFVHARLHRLARKPCRHPLGDEFADECRGTC